MRIIIENNDKLKMIILVAIVLELLVLYLAIFATPYGITMSHQILFLVPIVAIIFSILRLRKV